MALRLGKVRGTEFYYKDYSEAEHLVAGELTGGSGVPGKFEVKDIYLYYIGYDGNEYKLLGTLTGNTGVPGRKEIKGDFAYYIDYNGEERKLSIGEVFIVFDIVTKSVCDEHHGAKYGDDWSEVWNADGANAVWTFGCIEAEHFAAPSYAYYCRRTRLAWDTSPIPDAREIASAKVRIYIPGTPRHAGNPTMFLGLCPSLADTPEPADYGRMKDDWTLASESIAVSDLVPEQYNDIDLIAAGVDSINKTGWTKFSVRSSIDLAGLEPSGAIKAYVYFQLTVAQGHPCQLVVTYA